MTVRAIRKERKRLARARNMERRDGSKLSRREWFAIRRQFNECCAYCSRPALLEQDHVVPVRLGGLATPDNIVPACRGCNVSKGHLVLWKQWIPAKPHPNLLGVAPREAAR